MFCCSNCFSDNFLSKYISTESNQNGKCIFCRTRKHYPLLKATALLDLFQPLFDLYTEENSGKLMNSLLQTDWNIFSEHIEERKQLELLSAIIEESTFVSKRFLSILVMNEANIDKWNAFSKELKHENRFFPKKEINITQLKELFNYLIMPKECIPRDIYRARINRSSSYYSLSEMGKPPSDKAPDGRANPKGISYFYGASNEKTAIAESRPYKTDIVHVAKFKLNPKTILIDLRNPKSTISPFNLDDDSLVLLYEEHMPFLLHLSISLSKPILPHKKELEYLPTQYLCELIKDSGFNGIVFKSSLEKGDNYVIFDDSFVIGQKVDIFTISETAIKSEKQKNEKDKRYTTK